MDRETFLSKSKNLPTTDVEIDDGQTVKIRKLTRAEMDTLQKKHFGQGTEKGLQGVRFMVIHGLLNDDGSQMLRDNDAEAIGGIDSDTVEKIARAVLEFSGVNLPKSQAASEPTSVG
jgi:hypothetical protein